MLPTLYKVMGLSSLLGHIIPVWWKKLPFRNWKEKYFTFGRNTEH